MYKEHLKGSKKACIGGGRGEGEKQPCEIFLSLYFPNIVGMKTFFM